MARVELDLQSKIGSAVLTLGLITAGGGTAYQVYETHTPHYYHIQGLDEAVRIRDSSPPDSGEYRKANETIGNAFAQAEEMEKADKEKARKIWTTSVILGGVASLYGVSLLRVSRRRGLKR